MTYLVLSSLDERLGRLKDCSCCMMIAIKVENRHFDNITAIASNACEKMFYEQGIVNQHQLE